jgi:tetratricopeptide (TPR) repeat protein
MVRTVIAPALALAAGLAAAQAHDAPSTATAPASSAGTPDQPAAEADLAALLARIDLAWRTRDEPGQLDEAAAALADATRTAPKAYAVLWREARHDVWLAEDQTVPDKVKSEHGKRAWDFAEAAIKENPAGVEGWFYSMAGMGTYSLGIGIFSALSQGIEGKFKDRLSHAEKIDPTFLAGGIPTAWGRFYYKLPWPKHDGRKCEQSLRAALAMNPDNVRTQVYLGDVLLDEGHRAEARAAYEAALVKPPGQYDAPEERRWQEVARSALSRLEKR